MCQTMPIVRAGRQWCWEAMVLGGNSNSAGRQWCWEAIVLGGKSAGSILYYGHNYVHCARITISKSCTPLN